MSKDGQAQGNTIYKNLGNWGLGAQRVTGGNIGNFTGISSLWRNFGNQGEIDRYMKFYRNMARQEGGAQGSETVSGYNPFNRRFARS